ELDPIGWNGKAHAVRRRAKLWVQSCKSGDAYQVALQIHQRAATIARVDWSVSLNRSRQYRAVGTISDVAIQRADNAVRDRLRDAKRVSHSQYLLPYLQFRRVAEFSNGQLYFGWIYLYYRQIVIG